MCVDVHLYFFFLLNTQDGSHKVPFYVLNVNAFGKINSLLFQCDPKYLQKHDQVDRRQVS